MRLCIHTAQGTETKKSGFSLMLQNLCRSTFLAPQEPFFQMLSFLSPVRRLAISDNSQWIVMLLSPSNTPVRTSRQSIFSWLQQLCCIHYLCACLCHSFLPDLWVSIGEFCLNLTVMGYRPGLLNSCIFQEDGHTLDEKSSMERKTCPLLSMSESTEEMSHTRSCPSAYRARDYKILNRVSGTTGCQGASCL